MSASFRKVFLTSTCLVVCLVTLIWLTGSTPQKLRYRENQLHAASIAPDSSPEQVVANARTACSIVESILGTLDMPEWPESVPCPLDLQKVARSSGPVGRDGSKVERGLYRKHCVQCHGLTGDGHGPAASLLAPYPRDFRRGTFKFKSTPIGKKPTHADIVRTIENGIAGTSMPAFGTLNETTEFAHDVDALAHYVRFLSIRGEVERRLISSIEIDSADEQTANQLLEQVAAQWSDAESHQLTLPVLPAIESSEAKQQAIARGKELFESEITACVKCHGVGGAGKGSSKDFDDWTKDWTIRAGIDPEKRDEWRSMKKFGALKPVVDPSRNLTLGVFRGGSQRQDLLRRLLLGIEGTPMPPVARKENDNPGLTEVDLRDLIEYVLSLSEPNELALGQQASRTSGNLGKEAANAEAN